MQKKACMDCSLWWWQKTAFNPADTIKCDICWKKTGIYTLRWESDDKTNRIFEKICKKIWFDYEKYWFKYFEWFSNYFYKTYPNKISLLDIIKNQDFVDKYKKYINKNDIDIQGHIQYTYKIFLS